MKQRIYESATITADPATNSFPVTLISEGEGSSARFKREFFTQANADALAGSLSFPNHPADLERPQFRDPMSAIGSIADEVKIVEVDGKLSFRSHFVPAKSKPEVATYLAEFGSKLGLSVYGDSDGSTDGDGKYVAESLDASDPYKSVDLVVAAGARGKFEKISESLGLLPKTNATASEKEENLMELKDVDDKIVKLTTVVENLVKAVEGKATADLQVQADEAKATAIAEARVTEYAKAEALISEANLTESQSSDLRALALTGADITAPLDSAKKVLAEALALSSDDQGGRKIAEGHLPSGTPTTSTFDPSNVVPGFGKA